MPAHAGIQYSVRLVVSFVLPAHAGIQRSVGLVVVMDHAMTPASRTTEAAAYWMPAFAGMTVPGARAAAPYAGMTVRGAGGAVQCAGDDGRYGRAIVS